MGTRSYHRSLRPSCDCGSCNSKRAEWSQVRDRLGYPKVNPVVGRSKVTGQQRLSCFSCGKPMNRTSAGHVRCSECRRPQPKAPRNRKLCSQPTLVSYKSFERVMKLCTYRAAHRRCRNLWGSPSQYDCAGCGGNAREWAYDGTDPIELCGSDEWGPGRVYSRFPEFYMPLCRTCHKERDKVWRRKLQAQFSEFLQWKQRQLELAS
jgi:hypothetical protein